MIPSTSPAIPLLNGRDLCPSIIAIIPQMSAIITSANPRENTKTKNAIEIALKDTEIIPNTMEAMDNPILSCNI